jgi:ketosteroid isomerase-like protein
LCASGADIALRFRREQGFYAEAILISEQNVEIVKEAIERSNRRDYASFDDLYDSGAVWHAREDEPDTGVYRGSEAIRGLTRMWHDTFEEARVEIDQYIDCGDSVVAAGFASVRSRGSDAWVREPYSWAAEVRGGKIVEVREFRNAREALAALGLSK